MKLLAGTASIIVGLGLLGWTMVWPVPAAAIQGEHPPRNPPYSAQSGVPGTLGSERHSPINRNKRESTTRRGHAKTTPRAKDPVIVLANCYGRFIAWRDELAALMLQSDSYTPWPDDKIRFDKLEQAFSESAKRNRGLVLKLTPVFRETDFPADMRAAFRAGLSESGTVFVSNDYRRTQIMVIGQRDLSPRQRMAQLEANADGAFAHLSAPCARPVR